MHDYELMVILDPDIDERTVAPSLEGFLEVIRQSGGTVENLDIWASVACRMKSTRRAKAFMP